ncbi:hypothetical protein BT93_A1771 [Corymbia citriodora subsp. variegata]|nr:hypothetical protein BT93_A1771 [Corymbia citriodora subsp. variegata]
MAFVILMLDFAAAAESSPQSLAWPGCPDTCGNLTGIPYPFGIGSGCFLDPRFEIDCQRADGLSTPILKNLSVVVRDISLPDSSDSPGLIKVSQPILHSHLNCSANWQNDAPVDLRASNGIFRYSQIHNYFVAGGCDSLAMMASVDNPRAMVGCKSSCDGNGTLGFDQCSSGTGCCMTSIPDVISKYSVEFKTLNGETTVPEVVECSYAFLVAKSLWYQTDLNSLPLDVPVILEWAITSHEYSLLSKQKNWRGNDSSASCHTYSTPGFRSLIYCSCNQGYRGNYFLPHGCQDINESKEYPNLNCRGKCVNRSGSYNCIEDKVITMIGVGTGVGVIILLLLSWRLLKFLKRKCQANTKRKFFERNGGLLVQQHLSSIEDSRMEKGKLFTSAELDTATDHFNESRILGRGGQGTVYKGMLLDGTIVAVKKSKVIDAGQAEQFVNEVVILSKINHRNVVKLLGICLDSEVPLLVYEFVPKGTLYQYLHDPKREFPISWETRLRIASEVVAALSYLHFVVTILYYQTSQFTDKSDVYSFGVVLVELLTGEKPISQLRAEEGRNLSTYFVISMEENRLFDVLDKEVLDHDDKKEIIAVSNLAKRCLDPNGRNRPTMKEVAMELERVRSLRNPVIVRQDDEEMDCTRTGSVCSAVSTLMRSEADVALTSWLYDLPR